MKILIVEDEARIARRIIRMTTDYFGDRSVAISHTDNLSEAIQLIKMDKSEQNDTIDLLLLDLNLNGESGFELLGDLTARSFHTIIISANHHEALRAFEFGVLDFIPKPFNRERFNQAMNRLGGEEKNQAVQAVKFLSVHKRDIVKLVPITEVLYMRGAGTYSELILSGGKKELHNKSLEKLSQLLPERFFRIHKSYLVSLEAIAGINVQSGGKYTAVLHNGEALPIGRTRYEALKQLLG